MLKKLGCTVAVLCLAIWPSISFAKDYDLKPSSKWLMDYAPDSCRLMRVFGEGSDQITAQLIRYQPSDRLELNLIGKPLANLLDVSFAEVRFGDTGKFARVRAFPGGANDSPALFMAVRLDNNPADGTPYEMGKDLSLESPRRWVLADGENGQAVAPDLETRISTVTVEVRQRKIVLQLGAMTKPMAALRQCSQDLIQLWGLDPHQQGTLTRAPQPIGNPYSWIQTTYAPDLAFDSERALVHFRLMIDEQGKPTSCAVQANIEINQHFSGPGCTALMKYARFSPAVGPDGKAVASFYSLRAVWFMPPTPIEQRLMVR